MATAIIASKWFSKDVFLFNANRLEKRLLDASNVGKTGDAANVETFVRNPTVRNPPR